MSTLLVPVLYVMSGVCAYAALHHGLAIVRRRANRIHVQFVVLCLLVIGLLIVRAGAYQAESGADLVTLRRWGIGFACILLGLLPWFISEYAAIRQQRMLLALSTFWAALFAVNLGLPHGVVFSEIPQPTLLQLPWGESVVDLGELEGGFWHSLGWLGVAATLAYCIYLGTLLYRQGQTLNARVLMLALTVFSAFVLFNVLVNWQLVEFVHTGEFGFVAFIIMMDMQIMLKARDERQRLRDVLDHLPMAIALKDDRGRYVLINRAFERFFGADQREVVNRTDFDLFLRQRAEDFARNEALAIRSCQAIESQYSLPSDGRPRHFELHQFPLARPDGAVFGVCCVHIDATADHEKDEALHNLRHQVWRYDRLANTGAITSSLAHEISQPLSAILSNAQAGLRFLQQEPVDMNEIRELLEDIVRDDKRAGAVISGLRALLQKQEIPREDIDLSRAIDEVLQLLNSEFIRLGVQVEHRLEPQLLVRANRTQIQQVVLNLVMNALDALTERPGNERTLQLTSERQGKDVRVSVRDTGIGIPEDKLERIFDSFHTTKRHGLGVGLDVCRSIVQSHGGAIRAETNSDGGATFRFTLPCRSPGGQPPSDATQEMASSRA